MPVKGEESLVDEGLLTLVIWMVTFEVETEVKFGMVTVWRVIVQLRAKLPFMHLFVAVDVRTTSAGNVSTSVS